MPEREDGWRRWKPVDRDEVMDAFTRAQGLSYLGGRDVPDSSVLEAERQELLAVLIKLTNMDFVVAKAVNDAQA